VIVRRGACEAAAGCAALAALLLAGSGAGAGRGKRVDPPAVRYGPEREKIDYREREPAAKAELFRKINAERAAARLPTLQYDLFAAKVGDAFCLDAAANGTVGHYDVEGRAPYLRWALAGGVDYHGQNAGSVSRTGMRIREAEVPGQLLGTHASMMAEHPPDDGHRRTVLDPIWTHVGIGVAVVGGEFRMTEEYSRRVVTWVDVPSEPMRAGTTAAFTAQLPSGWNVGALEVAHEKFPHPLTAREIAARGSYRFPQSFLKLLPVLSGGLRYADERRGDFRVNFGRLDARIPLTEGPGNYYVFVYADRGNVVGRRLSSITGALIVAE
jgi:uncharacterized protein YkwD